MRGGGKVVTRWILWVLSGLLLGGIVHIATVLYPPNSRDPERVCRVLHHRSGQSRGAAAHAWPGEVDHCR